MRTVGTPPDLRADGKLACQWIIMEVFRNPVTITVYARR